MYKITENCIVNYAEAITFVKKQQNGVIVTCKKEESHGFLSKENSTIYAYSGSVLDGEYETGTLTEITLNQFIDEYMGTRVNNLENTTNALLGTEETA